MAKFEFSTQKNEEIEESNRGKNYVIRKVGEIQHPALIDYLKSRKVYEQKDLLKEIEYELNGKKYFGIGFFNNSGGIEIRNKYSKICLGKKDVALIKNELNVLNEIIVFEGFFDYLTYRNLENKKKSASDYLILNSTAMLFKVDETLREYDKITLFLDNDDNGNATTEIIQKKYKNVEDCSLLYADFKDLNEYYSLNKF